MRTAKATACSKCFCGVEIRSVFQSRTALAAYAMAKAALNPRSAHRVADHATGVRASKTGSPALRNARAIACIQESDHATTVAYHVSAQARSSLAERELRSPAFAA
jgi:hypothetical protein